MKCRSAEEVLADLDSLRDQQYRREISDDEFRRVHDALWDELRAGDRLRSRLANRNADRLVLAAAGYNSIKAALGDGYERSIPTRPLFGGREIKLTNHTLVKDAQRHSSETAWKKAGYRVRQGEQPVGLVRFSWGRSNWGNRGSYAVYLASQVEIDFTKRRSKNYFYELGREVAKSFDDAIV